MSKKTEAYNRGLAAGKAARQDLPKWLDATEYWIRNSYLGVAGVDIWDEMIKLDRLRLECVPSPITYPETRDLPDLVRAERQGFADGSGGGPRELAYHFSCFFFGSSGNRVLCTGKGRRAVQLGIGTNPKRGGIACLPGVYCITALVWGRWNR